MLFVSSHFHSLPKRQFKYAILNAMKIFFKSVLDARARALKSLWSPEQAS